MDRDHMLRPSLEHDQKQTPAPLLDQKKSAVLPSYPPPSYTQSHDAGTLPFPEVPSTELAPIQQSISKNGPNNNTLPSLSSVTGSQPQKHFASPPSSTAHEASLSPPPPRLNNWPSLNPLTAYYTPSYAQTEEPLLRMEVDDRNDTIVGPVSPGRSHTGRGSSVSLDDPDVRLAAEALGDLRADFVSSPPTTSTPLPASPRSQTSQPQPEPLLNLLTTSYPSLARTIEGTTSAYNSSKSFSPRFKSGAEYVEGYLTPIGNTLNSVGRATGVEGGVRWFLGAGRRHQHPSSDLESGEVVPNKRRKVTADAKEKPPGEGGDRSPSTHASDSDPFGFTKDRRLSMNSIETLPAYDEHRSPAYTEVLDAQGSEHSQVSQRTASSGPAAWQTRLICSTSGLSIAMNEESLRSLKYCLRWLRWANDHIANVISALKNALDQFSSTGQQDQPALILVDGKTANKPQHATQTNDRGVLVARITALKGDVLKTLQEVIEKVSRYAGGALPENARDLVRRHLTSLPQRFRLANQTEAPPADAGQAEADKATKEGAQRVLVLAREGLEMMSQVSGVLDGTIVSAEEWCERLGRKKKEPRREELLRGSSAEAQPSAQTADGDVVMQ